MKKSSIPQSSQVLHNDGQVPVILHTKVPGIPEKQTSKSLCQLSSDKRLFSHIAALSDVHQKKDIGNPTGSIVASEKFIIPQLFDSAPNCGMRIIATDLDDDDFTKIAPEEIFSRLLKVIPTNKYIGSNIPKEVIVDSFIQGSKPIADFLKVRTENEVENTYENGNLFSGVDDDLKINDKKELYEAVPPLIVEAARFRLGILGATSSHFLTLMKVDKIYKHSLFESLGLKKDQYVFFMHTGSGIIGRYIGYLYSAQPRSFSKKLQLSVAKLGFTSKDYSKVKRIMKNKTDDYLAGFGTNSPEGKLAVRGLLAAGNQGFANKTVLTYKLDIALEEMFGRQIKMSLVYDAPHILLSNEKHYGKNVWVHRNGASRAYGPDQMEKHSALSKTGEPIMIAPFENSYGYIGAATDNNKSTFYSGQHELGKLQYIGMQTFDYVSKLHAAKPAPESATITKRNRTVNKPLGKYASYSEVIVEEIERNELGALVCRLKPIVKLTHYGA